MTAPAGAKLADAIPGYDGSPAYPLPPKLSLTGLYDNVASKTRAVTSGIHAYDVNTPLWSDGAHKDRYIALPTGATVTPTDTDHFDFPDGTVMVKNFSVDTVVGDARTALFVETRFLVSRKTATGYAYNGTTYAWRRDQSDADLVDPRKGRNDTLSVMAGGKRVGKRWHFPAAGECRTCHINRGILGFITPQLNRPAKANPSVNQLQELFAQGILSGNPLTANPNAMKWASLDDAGASLELRSRSYLASNCSQCHGNSNRDYTGVSHDFDFLNAKMPTRYDAAEPGAAGPYIGKPAYADADMPQLLYPGHADSSFILKRMLARGTFEFQNTLQMPPLASYQPDSAALRVLADWTCTLGGKPAGAACRLPFVDNDQWAAAAVLARNAEGTAGHGFRRATISGGRLHLSGPNRNRDYKVSGAAIRNP